MNHGMEKGMARTICIDMDDVIVDFENCPEGCDYKLYPHQTPQRERCPMMDRADSFIKRIKALGYRVVIHTGRLETERDTTEAWLKDHDIEFDELVMGKPRAWLYIDDFGYRFQNWNKTLRFIENNGKKK